MAEIKTIQTILAELRTFLRSFNRSLDTGDNSLSKDLLLTPYSLAGKVILDQVGTFKDLHILDSLSGTDLDNEASNYKLERNTGITSTVTLTFYTTTRPIANLTIPAATQVQTAGTTLSTPISFSTNGDTTFLLSDVDSYYSYDRSRYEFSAAATCITTGTLGNVGIGYIAKLTSSVTEISGVTNLVSAIGGADQEIDDDLRERIRQIATGRDLNIVRGLNAELKSLGFLDAYAVRSEESEAERATGAEVYVIDNSIATYVETFTYDPSKSRYYFSFRPILDVSYVITSGGVLSIANYSVNKDSTSPLRRSVQALDYIEIYGTAGLVAGETFTVTYSYSNQIYASQQTLDLSENKILTSDLLIKKAYPMYLYINATLTLLQNADAPTTRNRVRNALSQYVSTEYRLNTEIQKSDLVNILQEGYGDYPVTTVDAVIINNYYVKDENGVASLPINETISISKKQHVVLASAVLI